MLQKYKGIFTKVIELHGTETLMPGLIEPHTHPSVLVVYFTNVNLSGFSGELKNKADVLAKIKEAVRNIHSKKPTTWLVFQGWDPAIITDLPSPDANTLDEIATPDYPVLVLNQALHSSLLNTKRLEVCNITKDTPRS